jgi:hypothetical protein
LPCLTFIFSGVIFYFRFCSISPRSTKLKFISSERKVLRSKSSTELSEKEARAELARAESLYVLGITSAYVEQARKAVEAKFGKSPGVISIGKPICTPALCVKMTVPSRGSFRLSDVGMRFFTV